MNPNLSNQVQMNEELDTGLSFPTQEEIFEAAQMHRLCVSDEWKRLIKLITGRLEDLTTMAFDSSKPQPARINSLERIKGIREVLEFPADLANQVDERLKIHKQSLEDYLNKAYEVRNG